MFLLKKDKLLYSVLFFVSLIGIATGINYQKTISVETIKSLKNSFEFGLYNFFFSKSFIEIGFSAFCSLFKHYVIFLIGGFNWATFTLIPLNLFGLGFKMGVVLSLVAAILKGNGIFEILFLLFFIFFIVFSVVIFCKNLIEKRIKINRFRKIDYSDIRLILISFFAFLTVFIILIFLLYFSKFINLKLYGIFTTFL